MTANRLATSNKPCIQTSLLSPSRCKAPAWSGRACSDCPRAVDSDGTVVRAASSESPRNRWLFLSKPGSRPESPPWQRNAILPVHSAASAPPSPLRGLLGDNDVRADPHDHDIERAQQMDTKAERARQERVAVELNEVHFARAPVPTKEVGLPRVLQNARIARLALDARATQRGRAPRTEAPSRRCARRTESHMLRRRSMNARRRSSPPSSARRRASPSRTRRASTESILAMDAGRRSEQEQA